MKRGERWVLSSTTLLVLLLLGVVFAIRRSQPYFYVLLIREDGWFEFTSVAAWIVCAIFFGLTAWRSVGRQRWVLFALAATALFLGMEEMSWGQRLLGFHSPEALAEKNLQKEITLHNLFDINRIYLPFTLGLVLATVGPWILVHKSARFAAWVKRWSIPLVPPELWPFLLGAAFLFGVISGHEANEIGELLLAVGFCAFGLCVFGDLDTEERRAPLPALLVMILAVGGLGWVSVQLSPDPAASEMRLHLNELGLRSLMIGDPAQAARVYRVAHESPDLMEADTTFYCGLALHASGQAGEADRVLAGFFEETIDPDRDAAEQIENLRDTRHIRFLGISACALGRPGQARSLFEHGEAIDRELLKGTNEPNLEASTRGSLAATLMLLDRRVEARKERSRARDLSPSPALARGVRSTVKQAMRLNKLAGCDLATE